ncbi:hypothetical protein [Actinomadura sediminis]|uniref:HEAT repeat domain-containing protein n=1 Tax=Actinomadura sediminis TaxID=1038904 RepID=A0ABW3ETA8_9ACTN
MDGEEFYTSPDTLLGALQHGLGRGAARAMRDPEAASSAVLACLRRDHRWWWTVDERAVYLARLVRDLKIPIARVLAVLDGVPPEDDENGAGLTLEVLEVLGRTGNREAVEGVRRHIIEGPHWAEALETVASTWDAALWDDLYPHLRGRLATADLGRVLWIGAPWTRWAERDERIAAVIEAAPDGRSRSTPEPTREPDLAQARRWVEAPGHPRYWASAHVLAREGEERDVPALLAAVDRVHTRAEGLDRCYRGLIEGLARIGGGEAARIVPRLRRLWFTPHTYERAAVLRALMLFAPAGEPPRHLLEGLGDCEADVRELAATHVGLTDRTRRHLAYLREDPMETPEVRAAAARRLD